MQKGLSIEELAAKITAQNELKHDFIADTRELRMTVDSDGVHSFGLDGGTEQYPMRDHMHRQVGAKLGVHYSYYDRMRKAAPELLATNVNHWLEAEPSRRLVRTLGGDSRAYLSDRYQRIENEEIAATVLPVLADIPNVEFVSTEVTDRRMYIQAIVPGIQADVKVGDTVQAGVVISNSEVGAGSYSVSCMIWRLVCLNGMILGNPFRQYHVGRRIADNEALWADDTKQADDKAVLLKARDMVKAAVEEGPFLERVNNLRQLDERKITADPVKAVEVLAKKIGATESESSGILRSLVEGHSLTAWGLTNAVTAQAHEAPSYDRAVELESAGGILIDLPANDWKEILEAA